MGSTEHDQREVNVVMTLTPHDDEFTDDELEHASDVALEHLYEHASDLAVGYAVAVNLRDRTIEIDFTVPGATSAEVYEAMAHIARRLAEHDDFALEEQWSHTALAGVCYAI